MTIKSPRVKVGEDLGFTRLLKSENRWPPHVTLEQFRSGDEHPATPFLFVPTSESDRGSRPVQSSVDTAWIFSPAVLLLNDQGFFEGTPRLNATYRIFLMVGNVGNAPVLNGIAEFFLDSPPTSSPEEIGTFHYEKVGLKPRYQVGSSPFSVGSRSWGWALSPRWTPSNEWHLNACIIARVFDPINDPPSGELKSWADRHVSFRVLIPDVAGTWSGQEITEEGETLGTVTVAFVPDWDIHNRPDGASVPSAEITVLEFPQTAERDVPLNKKYVSWMSEGEDGGYELSHGHPWRFQFVRPTGQTLFMRSLHYDKQFSHAVLSLKSQGISPPAPHRDLLKLLPRMSSSTWSPRRKADAQLVFHALAALGL